MATTRSRKTTNTTRKPAAAKSAPKNQGLAARTGRTVRDRPYASAAIATGAATLVAGLAGLFYMKKSGKSFTDVADDISSKSKELSADAKVKFDKYSTEAKSKFDDLSTDAKAKFEDVSSKVKDGVSDVRSKVSETIERHRDGLDANKTQNEIMEEALTLKETGKKTKTPVDPVVATQSKVGAISY